MHLPFDFSISFFDRNIWHLLDVSAVVGHDAVHAELLLLIYLFLFTSLT